MRAAALALVVGALAARGAAADPALGGRVFEERCAACHGASGAGDGPSAEFLSPRPRNFRDPAFWTDRPADALRAVVRDGKAGTAMPSFQGVLSDAEIDAVVAHVATFRPAAGGAAAGDGQASGARDGEDAACAHRRGGCRMPGVPRVRP